jgi:hypothetical protein
MQKITRNKLTQIQVKNETMEGNMSSIIVLSS